MKQLNKQGLRIASLTLAISSFAFFAKAQNTAPAQQTTVKNSDVATTPKSGTGAADGGAIRLIDNKGTIKYLQVQNGITQITNKATDGTGITTTWQLGGKLTDDTYIDVNSKVFAFDKLKLVDTATLKPSTDATDQSVHGTGTGFTVLVRNEVTGETEKILLSDLLNVISGQKFYTSDGTTTTYTPTGIPTSLNDISKVSVYRNGAKLIASADYTIAAGVVTLVPTNATGGNGDWALYSGDIIEIHWFK